MFNLIELNNCCIVQAYSLKFSDRYFWDWFIFPVWKNRCFFCKMEWKQHKSVIPNWIWDGGGKALHKTWGRVQKKQNGNLKWNFTLSVGPRCNRILLIWNGFYSWSQSKSSSLSPLIIGSKLTFSGWSVRWLPYSALFRVTSTTTWSNKTVTCNISLTESKN